MAHLRQGFGGQAGKGSLRGVNARKNVATNGDKNKESNLARYKMKKKNGGDVGVGSVATNGDKRKRA